MTRLFRISLFVIAPLASAFADDVHYKLEREIAIGGEGGWDILSIDPSARRLYQSHGTKVVVIDLERNATLGEIADTVGVHAFLAVPELRRGFSSNGKENKVSVIDLATLKTDSKIDVGDGPDAMIYDGARRELYVFNHNGNSATVIDVRENKVVATISLDGSPEFGAIDEGAGRVFVNLEDKSEVAVIDVRNHEVIARWPLVPGEEPTGLAFDRVNHRLFAVCHNKMMVMLDSVSGKTLATTAIGAGVDGCVFDDKTQLVFASCGEGVVTIAKATGTNELATMQSLTTERGARTIALDPTTHRIYLPTAKFQPAPSPPPGATPARPMIVPETFKLLVYGP